jgi:hypothetical protein
VTRRFLGSIITKNPTEPTSNAQQGAAPGVWTLQQALQYQKAGVWPTQGNGVVGVEHVFNNYVYGGDGTTSNTVTTGIDLSTNDGLVFIKASTGTSASSALYDTVRGVERELTTSGGNSTNGDSSQPTGLLSFNTDGFTVGSRGSVNNSGNTFAAWTFVNQARFFDCFTYTGDGTTSREISHSLGSRPGWVIIKRKDNAGNWYVAARYSDTQYVGSDTSNYLQWQSTTASSTLASDYQTKFTSTNFNISAWNNPAGSVNITSAEYVCYVFAHNDGDGDFGPDANADIIKCGSYEATNGSELDVDLGFEPQFVITKRIDAAGYWHIQDNIRGFSPIETNNLYDLLINDTTLSNQNTGIGLTTTGFTVPGTSGDYNSNGDYIYLAVRRGPMFGLNDVADLFKVFRTNSGVVTAPSFEFADMVMNTRRDATYDRHLVDRFRGVPLPGVATSSGFGRGYLETNNSTAAVDYTGSNSAGSALQNLFSTWKNGLVASLSGSNGSVMHAWRRSPKYFDVAAYFGTGVARTISHSLGAVPEMMWIKRTNGTNDWIVYHKDLNGSVTPEDYYLNLNDNGVEASNTSFFNSTAPTASVFSVGNVSSVNSNNNSYAAYLFATQDGISKVGTYTGTGSDITVDCGFTNGTQYLLVKSATSTANWYVWDSARGIVAGNDPYIRLDVSNPETTGEDVVDTDSSGFVVASTAPSGTINNSGETYIFYAVAAAP